MDKQAGLPLLSCVLCFHSVSSVLIGARFYWPVLWVLQVAFQDDVIVDNINGKEKCNPSNSLDTVASAKRNKIYYCHHLSPITFTSKIAHELPSELTKLTDISLHSFIRSFTAELKLNHLPFKRDRHPGGH